MRGIAAAPNSPLDIMLGLVDPIDPIHNEMASKSKPRQTDTRADPLVMTASAPADGCTDRGAGALVQGYRCTSTAPLVRVSHHGAVTATRHRGRRARWAVACAAVSACRPPTSHQWWGGPFVVLQLHWRERMRPLGGCGLGDWSPWGCAVT